MFKTAAPMDRARFCSANSTAATTRSALASIDSLRPSLALASILALAVESAPASTPTAAMPTHAPTAKRTNASNTRRSAAEIDDDDKEDKEEAYAFEATIGEGAGVESANKSGSCSATKSISDGSQRCTSNRNQSGIAGAEEEEDEDKEDSDVADAATAGLDDVANGSDGSAGAVAGSDAARTRGI